MGEIHSLLKREKVVESFCQNQYLFNTFIQYWKVHDGHLQEKTDNLGDLLL